MKTLRMGQLYEAQLGLVVLSVHMLLNLFKKESLCTTAEKGFDSFSFLLFRYAVITCVVRNYLLEVPVHQTSFHLYLVVHRLLLIKIYLYEWTISNVGTPTFICFWRISF
uniref:Secreted protein n=1 Tax=Parascaris univalens TaxID=6257 RepID=A0A915A1T4_PARUN